MSKFTDAFKPYNLSKSDQDRLKVLDKKLSKDDKEAARLMAIHKVVWEKIDKFLRLATDDAESQLGDALNGKLEVHDEEGDISRDEDYDTGYGPHLSDE